MYRNAIVNINKSVLSVLLLKFLKFVLVLSTTKARSLTNHLLLEIKHLVIMSKMGLDGYCEIVS